MSINVVILCYIPNQKLQLFSFFFFLCVESEFQSISIVKNHHISQMHSMRESTVKVGLFIDKSHWVLFDFVLHQLQQCISSAILSLSIDKKWDYHSC